MLTIHSKIQITRATDHNVNVQQITCMIVCNCAWFIWHHTDRIIYKFYAKKTNQLTRPNIIDGSIQTNHDRPTPVTADNISWTLKQAKGMR